MKDDMDLIVNGNNDPVPFDTLVGKTFTRVSRERNSNNVPYILFQNADERYAMYHSQDCCESVDIEDINGDLSDLENVPILSAQELSNDNSNPDIRHPPKSRGEESYTWTFYHLRTSKGYVMIRWYGTSNGYYSESVDLYKVAAEA